MADKKYSIHCQMWLLDSVCVFGSVCHNLKCWVIRLLLRRLDLNAGALDDSVVLCHTVLVNLITGQILITFKCLS